jgi:hypothetical protein
MGAENFASTSIRFPNLTKPYKFQVLQTKHVMYVITYIEHARSSHVSLEITVCGVCRGGPQGPGAKVGEDVTINPAVSANRNLLH